MTTDDNAALQERIRKLEDALETFGRCIMAHPQGFPQKVVDDAMQYVAEATVRRLRNAP